ncbi:MAG: hypothetical protein J6Q65_03865 [Lentisphaeria bacterium]|nr:hypothetical protein [Lentisphaeria bacterium]
MNMQTDKRILKIAFLFLLAVALPLQAQRNAGDQKKQLTKEQIRLIRTQAETCPVREESVIKTLKDFHAWANAPYKANPLNNSAFVPRDKSEKKARPVRRKDKKDGQEETEEQKSGITYYLAHNDFRRFYGPFEIYLKSQTLFSDMQEGTKTPAAAFIQFDKAVQALGKAVQELDEIRRYKGSVDEYRKVFNGAYKTALQRYNAAHEQLLKSMGDFKGTEYKKLVEQNVKARMRLIRDSVLRAEQ